MALTKTVGMVYAEKPTRDIYEFVGTLSVFDSYRTSSVRSCRKENGLHSISKSNSLTRRHPLSSLFIKSKRSLFYIYILYFSIRPLSMDCNTDGDFAVTGEHHVDEYGTGDGHCARSRRWCCVILINPCVIHLHAYYHARNKVVYTGKDTRIVMNTTEPANKKGVTDREVCTPAVIRAHCRASV